MDHDNGIVLPPAPHDAPDKILRQIDGGRPKVSIIMLADPCVYSHARGARLRERVRDPLLRRGARHVEVFRAGEEGLVFRELESTDECNACAGARQDGEGRHDCEGAVR